MLGVSFKEAQAEVVELPVGAAPVTNDGQCVAYLVFAVQGVSVIGEGFDQLSRVVLDVLPSAPAWVAKTACASRQSKPGGVRVVSTGSWFALELSSCYG